jgi:5'-phosphate synthase pdxT subunit
MNVGILALQGAFAEHGAMLDRLGAEHFEIRKRDDIERDFDALILPGGESTAIGKLLRDLELFDPLAEKINNGFPVFGTCAGLILLAREVEGGVPCFGCMDISVKRNAYGRQLGSFHTEADFRGIGNVPMTFIRAPYIQSVGSEAMQLAEVDGHIVAARHNKMLVTAFHPELTESTAVHEYFLKTVKN